MQISDGRLHFRTQSRGDMAWLVGRRLSQSNLQLAKPLGNPYVQRNKILQLGYRPSQDTGAEKRAKLNQLMRPCEQQIAPEIANSDQGQQREQTPPSRELFVV